MKYIRQKLTFELWQWLLILIAGRAIWDFIKWVYT